LVISRHILLNLAWSTLLPLSGEYDKDRADECNDIPGDTYNTSWGYGCIDSGLTEADCNGIKDNPRDIENHEALQEENRRNCYDD